MASQFGSSSFDPSQPEPFFERSSFGQQKKRPPATPASETPSPAITDSWREDFRFSDELEELERQQHLYPNDNELQEHFHSPPTYPVREARTLYQNYEPSQLETPTLVAQYNQLLDAYHLQAQRQLALEEYIASLQNENTELLHDNKLMARQIQTIFDEQAGEAVDEEEEETRKQVAKKARYQKIWGKLHLLL